MRVHGCYILWHLKHLSGDNKCSPSHGTIKCITGMFCYIIQYPVLTPSQLWIIHQKISPHISLSYNWNVKGVQEKNSRYILIEGVIRTFPYCSLYLHQCINDFTMCLPFCTLARNELSIRDVHGETNIISTGKYCNSIIPWYIWGVTHH